VPENRGENKAPAVTDLVAARTPELRVAILGGGIAGMVLAHELAATRRCKVDLIEKSTELGGLFRSVQMAGLAYDIGYFLFGEEHGLFRAFPELRQLFPRDAICEVVIRDGGFLDDYPITPGGYLRQFGISRTLLASASLIGARVRYRNDDTFPGWIRYYLGDVFYKDSGLNSYIERLHSAPDQFVGMEFAHQRLPIIAQHSSLRSIVRQVPQLLKILSPASPAGRRVHARVRPREGWPWVHNFIRSKLEDVGVSVLTGQLLRQLRKEPDGFRLCFPDHERVYHRVISTVPIPSLCEMLGIKLEGGFEYINLVSLFFRFRGSLGFSGSHLSNFTHKARWKRVVMFSQLYGTADGEHYFTVEITMREHEQPQPEELAAEFIEHVRSLGIFDGEFDFQGWTLTENAYPFLRAGDHQRIERGRALVERLGIECVGRQGTFRYLNSSKVASEAQRTANRKEYS
jgi:protoporphyrinogen oxidase